MSLTVAIVLTACLYLRGWIAIRKTRPAQFTVLRLACFQLGLATLWLATDSPLDEYADVLLSAHMVQHLLLISVIPPLLLLGWPTVPLLRALPILIRQRLVKLHRFGRWVISPPVAWIFMNGIFVGWHVPAAYDFALEHESWHRFEHLCFLVSSLAFWWCIVRPWPTDARSNSWGWLPYLVSADLVNTAVSAFLAFCDRPVYVYYLTRPAPFPISPLSDQMLGAVIMWVGGSVAFLLPAALMTFRRLQAPVSMLTRMVND